MGLVDHLNFAAKGVDSWMLRSPSTGQPIHDRSNAPASNLRKFST